MIVSHKHRFIYIKTLKTAGTSLEIALSKFCGADDIITSIDRADEVMRVGLGYRGAQNFRPLLWGLPKDLRLSVRSGTDLVKFFNHMPATMVRDRVPSEVWNSYFKFTSARDPYDLAVSLFYWKKRSDPTLVEIPDFLRRYGTQLYRNTEIVSEDGSFLLDDFVRFESFGADLERIGQKIGLPENLWESFDGIRAKGNVRKERSSAGGLLGPKERDVIRYLSAKEFEFFSYD